MINVNVSNNLQGVQGWDQLAGMVKAGETKAADADVKIENNQIVVTVSDGKEMQSVTVSVPDLGAMDEAPDTESLQSIAEKIVALADSLAAAGALNADGTAGPELQASIARLQSALTTASAGSPASGGTDGATGQNPKVGASSQNPAVGASDPSAGSMNTSKALFDLFALMALMVKVAQAQRDASREIRLTENQQIQNSIKAQADEMRSAAEIALGFGIACSVLSGVMSIASLVQQSRAFSQQTAATEQMEVPTQNLKAAQLATTPKAAEANLSAVAKKLPDVQQKINADTDIGTEAHQKFKTDIEAADTRLRDAQGAQSTAWNELSKAKNSPNAKTPEGKAAIAAKTEEYKAACQELSQAKQNRSSLEHGFFDKLDLRIRSNDAAIEAKQAELAASQEEAKTLKGAAADQAKTKIDSLKTEVADLKKENTYLRAYTAKAKADYASDGMKNADLARAQNKFDIAKQELQMNKQFAGSQQMMNRWMGIQQLTMTLSQMTNAAGNMIAETRRADATAEGVEQTQHNEQLDQIKDLFQQAETVVQAVVQLMQAVLSAENESLMEAIRA